MASRWITLFLLLAPVVHGADKVENNFGFYPKGAQKCLEDSSKAAGCTSGDSISALNTCLCGNNNNFIINSAKCIGDESPGDVDTTYDTMEQACGTSETPISVKKKAFQDAAAEGQASTTTATDSETTATSATESSETAQVTTTTGGKTITVVPTSDNSDSGKNKDKDDDGGLSTGATIGIGVGAAVVGAIAVGAGVFFFMRRRKKNAEESHPMLPNYEANHEYTGSTTYPPTEPKPAWSTANTPNPGQQGWGAPNPYPGAYAPKDPAAELPPQSAGNFVYEMDGTTPAPAVEMPGSTPQEQQGQQGWNR
ncbi:hypothetical protein ACJ41O_003475 [Fusarium nematophilum]